MGKFYTMWRTVRACVLKSKRLLSMQWSLDGRTNTPASEYGGKERHQVAAVARVGRKRKLKEAKSLKDDADLRRHVVRIV